LFLQDNIICMGIWEEKKREKHEKQIKISRKSLASCYFLMLLVSNLGSKWQNWNLFKAIIATTQLFF
jgi:hypothetical protein